jgi:spermidine/putrescine transport system permease protein
VKRLRTTALLAPGTLWLGLFFVLPMLLMLGASVLHRGVYGGVAPGFTLEHYRRLIDPLYLAVLGRTLLWALLATATCLLLGYPVAWTIACSRRYRTLLLILIVLPFWTSFLVRTFAMIFLLRDTGLVNTLLLRLGVIHEPLTLLYTPFAVLLGLVYGFLPFMVLPIYASLEKLDPALLEASAMLGARPAAQFFTVTLPLSLPGVIAGSLLVFVSALGSFVTSDLLGGAKQVMIGNLVQGQFTTALNWPFGSAISFVLMLLVLVAVLASLRLRAPEPGA